MIKKIDANEYGVVRYAITSVDELNRLPKKIAPSSQAILIENGLRVFVYGDGQWVEEVVDGDLSENMQSIVADYERSKIGYDGVKRGSLEERLKNDFQGIYDILNARDYCEYSGKELKVDNTWMGNQIDTRVEGRTLQNLTEIILPDTEYVVDGKIKVQGEGKSASFIMGTTPLIKSNTTYTLLINVSKVENLLETNFFQLTIGERVLEVHFKAGLKKIKFTTGNLGSKNLVFYFWTDYRTENGYLEVDPKQILILEGDYTQTPLSELPYFEGIESVGEREIGKNLLDPSELEYGNIVDGVETYNKDYYTNRKRSGFIKVKPNTDYVFSSNLDELGTNWWFYDINKKYITKEVYTKTINTPSNCEYIRVHNGHTDGTPLSNFKLQVEEGTVATEYEPFGYKIKGKSCGKNLCDNSKNKFIEIDSKTGYEMVHNSILISDYIKIDKKNIYTRVYRNDESYYDYSLVSYRCYDANKKYIGAIESLSEATYVRLRYLSSKVIKNIDDITFGCSFENFSLYEPYQESTYSIHSPIPLRSLPNGVCDVYDFESGAVIQRVGKVVLDGTQRAISRSPNSDGKRNTSHFSFNDYKLVEDAPLICDKLVEEPNRALSTVDNIECVKESGIIWINIYKTKADTIEELRTYLSTNPITVYYQLVEPIIHYLTPSQLKSFDGITHVISENTLIPTTTTKILTDTYANVSNVNSTAYSLRRGVNDVAETSDIINETDVEQDDVLDITMCAIDELYSMLEPNLE